MGSILAGTRPTDGICPTLRKARLLTGKGEFYWLQGIQHEYVAQDLLGGASSRITSHRPAYDER
jgi:hypothetical protein